MFVKTSIAHDILSREEPWRDAEVLKQAWGTWLSGLATWDWFLTLTFRDPPANNRNWTQPGWGYAKKAWGELTERVRPALGELYWFRAFEVQKWRGVPHIHALVGGLDNKRYAEVAAWYWQRYGFIRVLDYEPQLGAGFYVSKYVTKELGDIKVSPSLKLAGG